MSVGPRIVFTRFDSSLSPKLAPWHAHTRRVLGPAIDAVRPEAEGTVVWQLVSANNRQLARSVDVHDTFGEARTSAEQLVASAGELSVILVSEETRGVLGWFAHLRGRPMVTGARWYTSLRDRRHAVELAIRSIQSATVHVGARSIESTYPVDASVH